MIIYGVQHLYFLYTYLKSDTWWQVLTPKMIKIDFKLPFLSCKAESLSPFSAIFISVSLPG